MASKLIYTSLKTNRETLKVTSRSDVTPMKDLADGTEIQYKAHIVQEIVNEKTGEVFNSYTILSQDGKLYGTRSESFFRDLTEILEALADELNPETGEYAEPIVLMIGHRKSNNGREFTTCALI